MAKVAIQLQSARGNLQVSLAQLQGLFNGTSKDTPEYRAEILDRMSKVCEILDHEIGLIHSGKSPTIREWNAQGDIIFEGSVDFAMPAKEPQVDVTKEGVDALRAMVKG